MRPNASGIERVQRDTPLFTIVTVSLNAEAHIAEAIESVAAQTCKDYEYLIVDGKSTDLTMHIVRGFAHEFCGRLRWTSEPDTGLYDAMNKGLGLAAGTYVGFLGSDDHLTRNALEAVSRAVHEHDGPDIVCGASLVFGRPGGGWEEAPRSYSAGRVPKRAPARHQSMFFKREVVQAVGGFDTRYRIAADYDLYLRLLEHGAGEALIQETLSEFRLGGISSTSRLATALDYRRVRISHGSPRTWEGIVFLKSILAATASSWLRSLGRRRRS